MSSSLVDGLTPLDKNARKWTEVLMVLKCKLMPAPDHLDHSLLLVRKTRLPMSCLLVDCTKPLPSHATLCSHKHSP